MRKNMFALLFLAICPFLAAQQALNNLSVIKLVKAGLSDDVIVTTINGSPGNYDTSVDGLIALKSAGASNKVISAIVQKASGSGPAPDVTAPIPPPPPVAPAVPAGAESAGVYYQTKNGNWLAIEAETVNIRTQGFPAHTDGVLKEPSSKLTLELPVNFILNIPEERSIGEYQLLRFGVKNDRREFRFVSAWPHVSIGADKNRIDFDAKKIAPHIYQVTLGQGLGRGEYGFVPPTDAVSLGNLASNGKAYTFSVE